MNQDSIDILQHFYSYDTRYSNTNISAGTTYFKINDADISNNYVGIGTNSNIKVSDYLKNCSYFRISSTNISTNIGDLFELNLPYFSTGTINVDYKMFPNNNGLLIQFLKNTTLKFRYNIDCSFCIVGGGGGGGYKANSNAGGGGGAGELITGNITGYIANTDLTITIGDGGPSFTMGNPSSIKYSSTTITANGGGYGGYGKGNGANTTGSSSGGSGAYSNTSFNPGTVTLRSISNTSIFNSMISYGRSGAQGNDQNNDSGAGGGGGGAGDVAPDPGNENPGAGGAGKTITYGNKSFDLGGGGGGGGRENGYGPSPQGEGGAGGKGGGGKGGGYYISTTSAPPYNGDGLPGAANTGGGGGGAQNNSGIGGKGGSGTVIIYILPAGVKK